LSQKAFKLGGNRHFMKIHLDDLDKFVVEETGKGYKFHGVRYRNDLRTVKLTNHVHLANGVKYNDHNGWTRYLGSRDMGLPSTALYTAIFSALYDNQEGPQKGLIKEIQNEFRADFSTTNFATSDIVCSFSGHEDPTYANSYDIFSGFQTKDVKGQVVRTVEDHDEAAEIIFKHLAGAERAEGVLNWVLSSKLNLSFENRMLTEYATLGRSTFLISGTSIAMAAHGVKVDPYNQERALYLAVQKGMLEIQDPEK